MIISTCFYNSTAILTLFNFFLNRNSLTQTQTQSTNTPTQDPLFAIFQIIHTSSDGQTIKLKSRSFVQRVPPPAILAMNTFIVPFAFWGSVRQKEKTGPLKFRLCCLSVKTVYLRNSWRYRVEIRTRYSGLQSLETVKKSNF